MNSPFFIESELFPTYDCAVLRYVKVSLSTQTYASKHSFKWILTLPAGINKKFKSIWIFLYIFLYTIYIRFHTVKICFWTWNSRIHNIFFLYFKTSHPILSYTLTSWNEMKHIRHPIRELVFCPTLIETPG